MDLFHDTVIQECVREYCSTKDEDERYTPFVAICDQIIKASQGRKFPGRDRDAESLINDFCFIDHSHKAVHQIEEHLGLGVQWQPDVLGMRRKAVKAMQKPESGGRAYWADILLLVEMKAKFLLLEKLEQAQELRRGDPKEWEVHIYAIIMR